MAERCKCFDMPAVPCEVHDGERPRPIPWWRSAVAQAWADLILILAMGGAAALLLLWWFTGATG